MIDRVVELYRTHPSDRDDDAIATAHWQMTRRLGAYIAACRRWHASDPAALPADRAATWNARPAEPPPDGVRVLALLSPRRVNKERRRALKDDVLDAAVELQELASCFPPTLRRWAASVVAVLRDKYGTRPSAMSVLDGFLAEARSLLGRRCVAH